MLTRDDVLRAREAISDKVVRTPTLPPATHTNCYVIGGDEVIVIDPASPYAEEQALLDEVLDPLVVDGRVRKIEPTER